MHVIKKGQFVEWAGKRGCVVEDGLNPLKIRVYADGKDGTWHPTREIQTVTAKVSDTITKIDPLPVRSAKNGGREVRKLQCEVLETRDATETEPAQVWIRVNNYTKTDTYGTRFGMGGAKKYLEAHPNRPTFLYGHDRYNIAAALGHAVDWREDTTGLDICMEMDDFDAVPTAWQAFTQLKSGTFDSFSIGFVRLAEIYDDVNDCIIITEWELPEVSIVIEASNPGTGVLAMSGGRSNPADAVGQIFISFQRGEIDMADALIGIRDAIPHPLGDTGDQTHTGLCELASNVDAAIDAIRAELTNPTSDDNSQALALVQLADTASDALLAALGVPDPDDMDPEDEDETDDDSDRSKSPNAVKCPRCSGRGTILKGKRTCPTCRGDKKVLPITAAKHFLKGRSIEELEKESKTGKSSDDLDAEKRAVAESDEALNFLGSR